MDLKSRTLSNFAELVKTGECKKFKGRLKVGVDLGTANTVLAAVDTTNRPIAGISAPSHAIQDGVIVNYFESVQLVTKLKETLEERLGTELLYAAAAIPPGVSEGSVKSIGYVLEGAGFEVTNIVDEPTAASAVLKSPTEPVMNLLALFAFFRINVLKRRRLFTDDEYDNDCGELLPNPYEEAEVLKNPAGKSENFLLSGYWQIALLKGSWKTTGLNCICGRRFLYVHRIYLGV